MSQKLGIDQRPLRVAIVGSGPSGFYAVESLYKSGLKIEVSMFERLAAPFGLVRYGVAPDHPKIKNVIKVYEKTTEREGFSFFGNVTIGKDLSVEELKRFFDAIIFTNGAETDRTLGIEGEDLPESHTATEFVAWYNGHPDYKDRNFDLSGEVAVIVGQGNVAMDVCRILSKTVDELKNTDICQHTLDALSESRIKEVHMIGRRGPAQAAFTPVEIREFAELADCVPVFENEDDLVLSEVSQKELENPKSAPKKKNYDILQSFTGKDASSKPKKFVIHFFKSPKALLSDSNGHLEKLLLEHNELSGEEGKQKAKGTGKTEEMKCDIFFRSVGYRGIPIEGVPFRDDWGTIPHVEGRVEGVKGLYTAGWIKRGPSGIIGTNKPDSEETVKSLLNDLPGLDDCPEPNQESLIKLLKEKNINYITYDDWKKIDALERERGEKCGKPREKFTSNEAMLQAIK